MRMSRRALLVLSAVCILASTANAQQARFEHQQERVWRLENFGLLTGPSKDSSRAIVVRALREHGVADSALDSLVVVSESTNPTHWSSRCQVRAASIGVVGVRHVRQGRDHGIRRSDPDHRRHRRRAACAARRARERAAGAPCRAAASASRVPGKPGGARTKRERHRLRRRSVLSSAIPLSPASRFR